MKKRVLITLIALLVVCASVITVANASDSETGYAYQVYNPATNTVEKYVEGDTLSERLKYAPDGCVITLLDDVVETSSYTYVGAANGSENNLVDVYLDLNGHTLTYTGVQDKQFFMLLRSYVNLNVYSSRPGGTLIQTETAEGGVPSATFDLRNAGAVLNLGEVTQPVTLPSLDGITPTTSATDKVTYSNVSVTANNVASPGSNLTVFASTLVTHNTSAPNQTNVNINGGTYIQTTPGWRPAFFLVENNVTFLAKNATFIAPNNLFITTSHNNISADGLTYKFENCTIYTGTLLNEASYKMNFTFSDCFLFCDQLLAKNANSGTVNYERCLMSPETLRGDVDTLEVNEEIKTVSVPTIKFNYENGTLSEQNPYTVTVNERKFTYSLTTDTSIPCSTITWVDLNGNEYSQKYATGIGLVPKFPAISVPPTTDAYRYTFYPTVSEVTEDATYRLVPTANFILKSNIELHTDFVYKIYIPTAVVSSEYVSAIKIDGATPIFSETKTIEGEEYYVIRKSIKAPEAMDKLINMSISITTKENVSFEQKYSLSIPDYANRVNAGAFSENAKDLVNSVITYVKAAYDYYNPTAENKYTPSITHVPGAEHPGNNGGAKGIIYGVDISTNECVKFRFYVFKDVVDSGTNLTLRYQDRNVYTTVTVSNFTDAGISVLDNGVTRWLSYCEITTRAMDIRDGIEVSIGDTAKAAPDLTYQLANYIYYINSADSLENVTYLRTMMYALWEYSKCAENYILNTDSDSPVISISIDNTPVTEESYVIVANQYDDEEYAAAITIRDAIFEKTGETLEIVNESVSGKNSIFIYPTVPTSKYDFNVTTKGADLLINCSYSSFIENATKDFAKEHILAHDSDFDFSYDFKENYYIDRIYYSDFGAVGNADTALLTKDLNGKSYETAENPEIFSYIKESQGWVNDFAAIKATHDMANATGRHTVYADEGKTYYIGTTKLSGSFSTAIIQTDVVWTGAKFIIDDTHIDPFDGSTGPSIQVFSITSDKTTVKITDRDIIDKVLKNGLDPSTTNIDLGLDYPVMIVPYNSSHKIYRRRGYSSFSGMDMQEIIVLDENGNVSSDTPVMFTYTDIDYINVIDLRVKPITVEGGEFTTVSCGADVVIRDESGTATGVQPTYVARGINVERSFTTFNNVKHYVVGEITVKQEAEQILGVRYSGFFNMHDSNEITLNNCVMTARRCFGVSLPISNGGTYEYSAGRINNLIFNNCVQTNFWVDGNGKAVAEGTPGAKLSMSKSDYAAAGSQMYWGTGCSNHCKNMEYRGSTLSRFDAHEGLYNGKIIDSTVNFISLIGGGDMLIENSRWFTEANPVQDTPSARALIYLRSDYGSTWNGTITIKNVSGYTHEDKSIYLIYHNYANWYYGYRCYFPNVNIDGLDYYDIDSREAISSDKTIILSSTNSQIQNWNIHSSLVNEIAPAYEYVDRNGDGYVDKTDCNGEYIGETGIVYQEHLVTSRYNGTGDTNEKNYGTAQNPKYQNLNPIVPPTKIIIENSNYNYEIPHTASFFEGTYIRINGTLLKMANDFSDVPIVDYKK